MDFFCEHEKLDTDINYKHITLNLLTSDTKRRNYHIQSLPIHHQLSRKLDISKQCYLLHPSSSKLLQILRKVFKDRKERELKILCNRKNFNDIIK